MKMLCDSVKHTLRHVPFFKHCGLILERLEKVWYDFEIRDYLNQVAGNWKCHILKVAVLLLALNMVRQMHFCVLVHEVFTCNVFLLYINKPA